MQRSTRHHFIAQFYQRNFAQPMFSANIRAFMRKSRQWYASSPRRIGSRSDLYTLIMDNGEPTDSFEKFLSKYVEGPATPAMKKAALAPEHLTDQERSAVAWFIGVMSVR